MHSSSKGVLIAKTRVLRQKTEIILAMTEIIILTASILASIINKKIAKINASFLVI